jgi:hypothetical protein
VRVLSVGGLAHEVSPPRSPPRSAHVAAQVAKANTEPYLIIPGAMYIFQVQGDNEDKGIEVAAGMAIEDNEAGWDHETMLWDDASAKVKSSVFRITGQQRDGPTLA